MVFVNNRGQTTHAPTSQHIEASKTCNSPNEISSDVNRKSTTSHNSLSESGQNDKNNNANIPIPNNPDHLVALHLVTTGVQGEDLGTDEKPVTWWTFLVLDVTKNKVTAVQSYPVRPLIDPNHMEAETECQHSPIGEECTQETGITDAMVENALTLEQVLEEFDRFLRLRGIHPDTGGRPFALVTEGQLPLRLVLHPETCGKQISLRPYPYFYRFFDLRKEFLKFYKTDEAAGSMEAMLEYLDIEKDKSLEYGVRKCQDMARLINRLIDDGHRWENPCLVNQSYFPAVVRRTDVIEEDTVVRARGLPWQATDSDIDRFFRGLNIVPGGIALVLSKVGRRNGEALVRFESREHRELAVRKHKHHMSQRYIEVYISSGREFIGIAGGETKEAEDFLKKLTDPGQTLVRMRGLPYTTTADQILKFFSATNCEVQNREEGILFVNHRDGRSTGDAFVVFGTAAEADRALQNHRQHIGDRYIELFKSTPAEVNQVMNSVLNPASAPATSGPDSAPLAPNIPFHLTPGMYPLGLGRTAGPVSSSPGLNHQTFIRVRGMPVDATVADILKFLDTLSQFIVFQGVHLVYNTLGHPAGEAIIQMTSEAAAAQVVEEKNKKFFYLPSGKRSQVEVARCNPADIAQFSGLLPASPSVPQLAAPTMTTAMIPRSLLPPSTGAAGSPSALPGLFGTQPTLLPTSLASSAALQTRLQAASYAPSAPQLCSATAPYPWGASGLSSYPTAMMAQPEATPTLYYMPNASMVMAPQPQPSTMTMVIAKGLPGDAMLEEILSLFDNVTGSRGSPDVKVGLTLDGKPSGEAFISFQTRIQAERAVSECNRKLLRNHYVELSMAQPSYALG